MVHQFNVPIRAKSGEWAYLEQYYKPLSCNLFECSSYHVVKTVSMVQHPIERKVSNFVQLQILLLLRELQRVFVFYILAVMPVQAP